MKKIITIAILAIVTISFGIALPYMLQRKDARPVVVEPKIYEVSLYADRAVPDELAVPIGEYIQFNSKDGSSHDISQGKGTDEAHTHDHAQDGIESGLFGPDEGFRATISKVGVYYFHDHTNPNVIVTVLAYDPTVK